MVDNLVDLCEDTIQLLILLKLKGLISENELKNHLEKKSQFIKDVKIVLSP